LKTLTDQKTLTKTPRTIVGIDYSLNSPAVCVANNGGTSFSDCNFYYLTSKKKYEGIMMENVIGYRLKENNGPIERFKNLSDWVLHILETLHKKQEEKIIFIEGYSYGSKGRAIFQIAENGGILKYRLQKRYTCKTIVPSVIKKFATGKGNADKQMMYDTFKATQGVNLMKVFDQEKLNNPITDIIDSYYIMRAGYENSICNDI
jgi:Holliday junction resolvasome RuvABC endonuclease subunit